MMRRAHAASTARNAPFGTDIQARVKTKIIGGKEVEVNSGTPPTSAGAPSPSHLKTGPHGTPPMQYQSPLESNNNSYNNSPNPSAGQYRKVYSQTAPRDSSNSHIHSKAKVQEQRPGAPSVLPPINSDQGENENAWTDGTSSAESLPSIKDILQKPFPVHLAPSPALSPIGGGNHGNPTLTEQVSRHLAGYDPLHFKEMYTDLAEFDHGLHGYVSQPRMNMITHQHKLPIPLETLRLLFSNFALGSNPDMVNYEKLIQFLARAQLGSSKAQTLLQQDVEKFVHADSEGNETDDRVERLDIQIQKMEAKERAVRKEKQRQREEIQEKKKEQQKWKPSFALRKPLKTFSEVDDAMLICMLEEQFTDGKKKQAIDVAGMRDMSMERDKQQNGTFTRKDLDELFLFYRIPIQGSLLNKMLQRIDTGNGQLSWVTFLEILERVEAGEAMTPRSEKGQQSQAKLREQRRASEGLPMPRDAPPRGAPPRGAPPTQSDPFQNNSVVGRNNSGTRSRDGSRPQGVDGLRPVIEPKRPSTWPKRPIKEVLPMPEDSKDVSSPPWLRKPLARIEASQQGQAQNGVTDIEMEITRNDTPTDGSHYSPPMTASPEREDYEIDQLRQLAHDHKNDRHHHVAAVDLEAAERAKHKREKRQREDWFKGFLHLAKGLYSTDSSKTGCLDKDEIIRLVNNYNLIYQLGISPSHIRRVIDACCHERDVVPIKPVLEILRQNKK